MHNTLTTAATLQELDGVLFDFNGTLSDDESLLRELFIELAAARCGVQLTADYYHEVLAGRSDREIMEEILALAPESAPQHRIEEFFPVIDVMYAEAISQSSTISPETVRLLKALHAGGLKLGVVTGASRRQVIPALERADVLGLFGVVVTDEDVATGKPSPEGFELAARKLGLQDPSRIAAFEDSIPGLGAVKAAGMIPICVEGTHPLDVLRQHADLIISEISTDCLQLPWANTADADPRTFRRP